MNIRTISEKYGVSDGTVRYAIKNLKIKRTAKPKESGGVRRSYTIDELKRAVKNNFSIAGVCRELGLADRGGNYKTIKN